jgi:hypothetical protein
MGNSQVSLFLCEQYHSLVLQSLSKESYVMKYVCILAVAQQLANLVGENPASAFSFETRTLQYRFRESLLVGSHGRPSFRSTTSARSSMNSKPEEYDDGIGDNPNPKTNSDGEDLASEFYKILQKRKDIDVSLGADDNRSSLNKAAKDTPIDLGDSKSPSSMSPSSFGRRETSSLFETNDDYDGEENKSPTPKVKFTGRPMDGNDYFGGSYNVDTNNNVREEMMRKEYQLVSGSTSKQAFIFQVGLVLSMLTFFIYIGLTGGIVTGEEATQMDFGGDDMIQFEQIIPIPRDSNDSVWI